MRTRIITAALLLSLLLTGCASTNSCGNLLMPWLWKGPCDARPASYKREEQQKKREARELWREGTLIFKWNYDPPGLIRATVTREDCGQCHKVLRGRK